MSLKRFSFPPPSPVSETFPIKRRGGPAVPSPLRLDIAGVDPSILIGKVLQKIIRSSKHPMMTFHFNDSSVYQVHVEGYHPNPAFRGVPKELEVNSSFDEVLTLSQNPDGPLDLTVTHCSFIRLTDKAFQRKPTDDREDRWDQNHLGLALKFKGRPMWHCVWAAVVDHDENFGKEVFRSYEDVYLQHMTYPPSPTRSATKSHFTPRKRRT